MPQVPFTPTTEIGAVVAELKTIIAKLDTTNLILGKVAESLEKIAAQSAASDAG